VSSGYQYIIDRANGISINKRAVVAQTISRDQTVRAVSRGGQVWRFDITPPGGMVWTDVRPFLEDIDLVDRYTPTQIKLNNTKGNFLLRYQGSASTTAGWNATWIKGSNQIFVAPNGFTSGTLLAAGDVVQLGSAGRVYTVAVTATAAGYVTLNRPVLEASGNGALTIGSDVTWTVLCTEVPSWNVFGINLVNFTGSFKFVEYMG